MTKQLQTDIFITTILLKKKNLAKKYTLYNDNYARIKEKCILQLLRKQKYQMEMREGAQDLLFYILVNRFGLLPCL